MTNQNNSDRGASDERERYRRAGRERRDRSNRTDLYGARAKSGPNRTEQAGEPTERYRTAQRGDWRGWHGPHRYGQPGTWREPIAQRSGREHSQRQRWTTQPTQPAYPQYGQPVQPQQQPFQGGGPSQQAPSTGYQQGTGYRQGQPVEFEERQRTYRQPYGQPGSNRSGQHPPMQAQQYQQPLRYEQSASSRWSGIGTPEQWARQSRWEQPTRGGEQRDSGRRYQPDWREDRTDAEGENSQSRDPETGQFQAREDRESKDD